MSKKAIFVMLLIWATPLCVKGTETAETNEPNLKHEQQTTQKSKVEVKSTNNGPNVENDQENLTNKLLQLQYSQLLEIHRSYFTIFLQVLSIYLAVMGASLKIVSDSIVKMKTTPKEASKTVLITLVLFSLVASILFVGGVALGNSNAGDRSLQITDIAKELSIVPINVDLLKELFELMIVGTALIIILWVIMFFRALMACTRKATFIEFVAYIMRRILGLIGCVKQ